MINLNEEHLTWIPLPHYKKNSINSGTNITTDDDFMPSNDIGWMQKFRHVVVSKEYYVCCSKPLKSLVYVPLSDTFDTITLNRLCRESSTQITLPMQSHTVLEGVGHWHPKAFLG